MKKKLLGTVVMLSKVSLRVFLINFVFCSLAFAYEGNGQSKSLKDIYIQIEIESGSVLEVFKKIEDQTDFIFSYEETLIDHKVRFNFDRKTRSIEEILRTVGNKVGLNFRRLDGNIDVSRAKTTKPPSQRVVEILIAHNVTGIVTNENGEPLPGASVLEKGTSNGTVTDLNGRFGLDINDGNGILVVSFIGYVPVEVPVNERSQIDVTLLPDIQALQEIVVVGYATTVKANLTGSVSTLKVDDVVSLPVSDPTQLLYGRVTGVQLEQNTGEPGSGTSITIRGPNLGNSNPLIVVDGVIVDSFDEISPSDIASFTVLKDAASAAIYGAQAGNGVVLITTKTGRSGKPRITYNASVGQSRPVDLPELLQSTEYMRAMNEREVVGGGAPLYPDSLINAVQNGTANPDYFGNDDWFNELFGPSTFTDHYISISGGSENTRYLLSGRYNRQEGTVTGPSALDWYNVRAKVDTDVAPWLNIGMNLVGNYRNLEGFRRTGAYRVAGDGGLFNQVFRMSPLMRVNYANGEFAGAYSVDGVNPEPQVNPVFRSRQVDGARDQYNLLAQFTANVKLLEGFTYEPSMVYEYNAQFLEEFLPAYELFDPTGQIVTDFNADSDFFRDAGYSTNFQFTNLLRFRKSLNDKHEIGALLGHQIISQDLRNNLFRVSAREFASDDLRGLENGNPSFVRVEGLAPEQERFESYFSRLEYRFDSRFLFEVNFRVDGSSLFPEEDRYAFFPAFSLGWRISEEAFMSDLSNVITDLKLRGSWGTLGSTNNLRRYAYIQTYNSGADYIFGDGNLQDGTELNRLANPVIRWEETETTNIGLDMLLFEKLGVTADWYQRDTDDLLITDRGIAPSAGIAGNGLPFINGASVRNAGWELALTYFDKVSSDLEFNAGFNLTYNKNEVTATPPGTEDGVLGNAGQIILINGEPVNAYHGLIFDGIYQTQEEVDSGPVPVEGDITQPGFRKYRDISGPEGAPDGIVDTNFDRTVIGNPFPKFVYGFNGQVLYKNFDLSFTFSGVADVDRPRPSQGNSTLNLNMLREWENRWSPENPSNEFPLLGSDNQFSSWHMVDGSYLRLKLLEFGYTIPASITERVKIERLRFYFSGTNLLTFTNFVDGFDPERTATDLRQDAYPLNQTFVFGLNLSF